MIRRIQEVKRAQPTTDGAGVAIQRVSGFGHLRMDPILMLDELRSERRDDFAAGFPPHPHRGMQTLTYMKHGGIIHEDNQGNRGEIRSGGAQYMSAGRGIIHSEMPTQDSEGLHGFQLWFNLPAALKMGAPRYRDLPQRELRLVGGAGFRLTVVSGEWQTADSASSSGPLHELAPQAAFADAHMQANTTLEILTAREETVLVYIYDGALTLDGSAYTAQSLLVFGEGERLQLHTAAQDAGLLILRGQPLREPVVHYGPFVMNTQAEIDVAVQDYQSGRFAS